MCNASVDLINLITIFFWCFMTQWWFRKVQIETEFARVKHFHVTLTCHTSVQNYKRINCEINYEKVEPTVGTYIFCCICISSVKVMYIPTCVICFFPFTTWSTLFYCRYSRELAIKTIALIDCSGSLCKVSCLLNEVERDSYLQQQQSKNSWRIKPVN